MAEIIRRIDVIDAIRRKDDRVAELKARMAALELQLAEEERAKSELASTLEQFDRIAAAVSPEASKAKSRRGRVPIRHRTEHVPDKAHARADVGVKDTQADAVSGSASPRQRRRRHSEISALVRRIITEQTGEFTGPQILEQLKKVDEALAKRIPEGYMSTLLWRMAQAKQVVLVRKGGPGMPNVYSNRK